MSADCVNGRLTLRSWSVALLDVMGKLEAKRDRKQSGLGDAADWIMMLNGATREPVE